MIFQGPGCSSLINDSLNQEPRLSGWQLKDGAFPDLKLYQKKVSFLNMPTGLFWIKTVLKRPN